MKTCSKCKIPKAETEFYRRAESRDGRTSACKACEFIPAAPRSLPRTDGLLICSKCKVPKANTEFYKATRNKSGRACWCKPCSAKYFKGLYYKDPEKYRVYSRDRNRALTPEKRALKNARARPRKKGYHLKYDYGLTLAAWAALLEGQGGVCAICKKVPAGGKGFCVDHDHSSKKIRGLLCMQCNVAVGMLKESVATAQSLIDYLKSHSE